MRKREDNELKNSGIDWIGKIPAIWDMSRAGFIFNHKKDIAKTESHKYERLSLTMQGVLPRSKEDTNGLAPDNFDGYQIVKPNDLLFKLIDLANIATSRVGLSAHEGIVSGAYVRLECSASIIPKYAYYFYMDMYNRNVFNGLGSGVRSALNAKDLLKLKFPLPDLATQQRIAAFLDTETSKIDALSEELTKFKSNLLLQKRSLVSECVTKGIPSERDRAYKDSGLNYLSDVMPLVWEKFRLKNVLSGTSSGATPASGDDSYYTDDENAMPWVAIGDMGENFTSSTKNSVTEKALKDCRLKVVPSGTLLYSMYASVGFVSELTMEATTNQAILALYLNEDVCNKRFVKYWLKNMRFYVDRLTSVSTQSNLNANKVINLDLFLPPLDEQQRIADYLDSETAKIDALIGEIDNQVNLLKTYRKSLINEVVTGKIEVKS